MTQPNQGYPEGSWNHKGIIGNFKDKEAGIFHLSFPHLLIFHPFSPLPPPKSPNGQSWPEAEASWVREMGVGEVGEEYAGLPLQPHKTEMFMPLHELSRNIYL